MDVIFYLQYVHMIERENVYDVLCLTMLVYKYNTTDTSMNINDTIITKDMSECDMEALKHLQRLADNGNIEYFISDETTDLQCAITVSHRKKRFTVVFRGSESYTDWWYNLQIKKVHLNDVKVHGGYLKQLLSTNVCDKLVIQLKALLKEHHDYDVFITGHSAGAALATIFSYMLSPLIKQNITVISFASPRVGNGAWKESYQKLQNVKHYRIVNNRDVVTVTPYIRYHHCGIPICINKNGKYTLDKKGTKWFHALKGTILYKWSVSDHSCDAYYKALIRCGW